MSEACGPVMAELLLAVDNDDVRRPSFAVRPPNQLEASGGERARHAGHQVDWDVGREHREGQHAILPLEEWARLAQCAHHAVLSVEVLAPVAGTRRELTCRRCDNRDYRWRPTLRHMTSD